jgi:GntR family transcriptional regulator/MocR family aminotransferase
VNELPTFPAAARKAEAVGQKALSARGRLMSNQPFHHGHPSVTAFHPGLPDADHFPFNTWARLLTRRAKSLRGDLFGSYHVTGYPQLREALSRYLAASRGVSCTPDQVVVTNGAQAAFDLLARLLTDPGDAVWMEEPGYYGARAAFVSAGATLLPLKVDSGGWDLSPPARPPRAIFVTPSCHHPLGVTMTMEQRLTLIRCAGDWKAWIVEDDYDSEYRFQGQPIPALQGTATDTRIVFVGTFAKILFPALRLGYMVVPRELQPSLTAAISATGQFPPLITQAALADFISEGYLTRHLRRMRRVYAARRQEFIDQFDRHLGRWMELQCTDSGIQLAALFRMRCDDRRVALAAQERGVNVSALSLQYAHQSRKRGLLLGFAASDTRATRKAIFILANLFEKEGLQEAN